MDAGATADYFLGETITPEALLEPLPDAVSTLIIERLKQEADRHWDINPRRSLEFAGRIIAIGKARGDARQTALGMMARGDALKFLGETDEAWSMLEQAGEMFLEAGDEVGWARTRIGRLHLGIMLNRVEQTLAEAQPAREILLRHGETEKLMRLIFMTAYVYNYLGDQQKTLELYRPALEMALSFGKSGQAHAGKIIMNMGVAYENLGELEQALDHYQRAYEIFLRLNEPMLIALVESSLASIAQSQGRYRQALRLLNSALEHMGACAEVEDIARTNWHILDCYLNLHKLEEARQLARQIVADFRSVKDQFELSRSLLQLATAEAESGSFVAAQTALDEAEVIFNAEGATLWTAITRLKRGQVALRQGNPAIAYQNAIQASASFEAAGQKLEHAAARLLQGQALLALGDQASAWRAGKEVLQIAQRYAIPSLRYNAHLLLGQLAEQTAALRRAERHYRAAAATSERLQRGLTITLRPGFLEDKAEAWHRLIGIHMRSGNAGSAFATLERAKSQVLLGYLANRESLRWAQDDPHSRELIAELERLRGEHQIYYRQAHELPRALHSSGTSAQEGSLSEVKRRERRMRAITEQLYLCDGEGRTENPAPTPTLEDLQNKLDERTLLIEYYFVGSQAWAFKIDQQTIQVHELTLPPETLEQLQAQLRANTAAVLRLDPRSQAAGSLAKHAQRILQRLYAILIEPFKTRLHDKERLIIVPYGSLHALPFHLLYDGSTYLIENFEVVTLPAAGLATQTGPQRAPGALTLAHSWEGRLPNTQSEALTVQQIMGGEMHLEEAAQRATLQSQPCQVLHIAAHGEYRLDQPDLSYIQLADGQLYADDLFQQDLSYELVTLSACETGQAKVSGGDELIGLGRGFLYAGAGALVLSLWQVADATTETLMEVMYKVLRKGLSKSAGLRLAQRQVLRQEPGMHPAFWGAFELIGDDRPLTMGADGFMNGGK